MLMALVFLYAFGLERNKKRIVSAPEIEFVGESKLFITEDSVNKLLIENFGPEKTIAKENLVLKKLESVLINHPIIEKAEVFVTTKGELKAQVKQKTPVARVYNNESSFYIDYQGNTMPLSNNFSARVPLVSAPTNPENKEEFTRLLRYIHDDEFLKKNITGIEVLSDESILLKNRNYNYSIDFGKPQDIEQKFNNYKAFFQKASQDSLIEKYSKINLRFTKQVVCTKNE
jgi:cell division protein FtsQ